MTDITELERRITAALDRISIGLPGIGGSGDAGAEVARLREALEAEQTANAQLEERVKAIRDRQEQTVSALEAEVARLREAAAGHEAGMQRLKRINDQLRQNNLALREANQEGVGDPHLINKAMMTELDALRTTHDADRAELDAVLGALRPLLEGEVNA
jgi:chromosome segregation ATPase